jgi:hypothetical protein
MASKSKSKGCITKEAEIELKPYELANLLATELNLKDNNDNADHENDLDSMKPKDIVALANKRLGIHELGGEATVKEEARHSRATVRGLPSRFWTPLRVRNGSSLEELLQRLLAKPASAGGFSCAMAAEVISSKNIDTKSIVSQGGATAFDGFDILRPSGAYSTLDHDLSNLFKLFRSAGTSERIGDCSFAVQERTQPCKGQVVMTAKATKCTARYVALLTPKWLLVGVYQHVGSVEAEDATLALFEELRLELAAPK